MAGREWVQRASAFSSQKSLISGVLVGETTVVTLSLTSVKTRSLPASPSHLYPLLHAHPLPARHSN